VGLLMTEGDYGLVGMRPAVGRLANAMIAALGPELRRGSPAYNQCRATIREMQASNAAGFEGCSSHVPTSHMPENTTHVDLLVTL